MKKTVLFGASRGGENFIINNPKMNIVAIADNDSSRWGKELNGIAIISPKELMEINFDKLVITSQWVDSIRNQLMNELDIVESKIEVVPKNQLKLLDGKEPFSHPETLAVAQELIINLTKALDENNIKIIADYGTALGIVRDGDLIKWDDDIDFSVADEEFDSLLNLMPIIKNSLPKTKEAT